MIINFDESNVKIDEEKVTHDEELDDRIRKLTEGCWHCAFLKGLAHDVLENCRANLYEFFSVN